MLSQSVINLVDAAMVGRLGELSLAAVGIGSYASFAATSLVLGLSSAVQAIVARRRGEGRFAEMAAPVNAGLLISLCFALPLSLLLIHYSAPLMGLLSQDDAVRDIAEAYFDYRIIALVAIGFNLSLRGWWNGTQRPGIYLRILLATHLLNVVVSYLLIFGQLGLPALGAPGAGLGTAIALVAGGLINLLLVSRDARENGFLRPYRQRVSLAALLRLSAPHSLQQFLFAVAFLTLFWIIGRLGSHDQAIAHILINLALFLILPAVGLGVAATSLVSQALGENKPEVARRWGWDAVKTALGMLTILSLPMWLAPEPVLRLFFQSPELIEQARLPLQLTGLAICLDVAAIVLTQALLGAGAARPVLLISGLGQWCLYLPLAWLFGPQLGFGLLGIWLVQLLHRALSSALFIYIWSRGNWARIRL